MKICNQNKTTKIGKHNYTQNSKKKRNLQNSSLGENFWIEPAINYLFGGFALTENIHRGFTSWSSLQYIPLLNIYNLDK